MMKLISIEMNRVHTRIYLKMVFMKTMWMMCTCTYQVLQLSLMIIIRFLDDDSQRYCCYIPDFKENVDRLYSDAQLSTLQAVIMLFTWFSMFPGMSKEALINYYHYFMISYCLLKTTCLPVTVKPRK